MFSWCSARFARYVFPISTFRRLIAHMGLTFICSHLQARRETGGPFKPRRGAGKDPVPGAFEDSS